MNTYYMVERTTEESGNSNAAWHEASPERWTVWANAVEAAEKMAEENRYAWHRVREYTVAR